MLDVLCENCGHVMGRKLGRCTVCRGKTLTYYRPRDRELLKMRVREIKRYREPMTAAHAAFIVAVVATGLVFAVDFAWKQAGKQASAESQTNMAATCPPM